MFGLPSLATLGTALGLVALAGIVGFERGCSYQKDIDQVAALKATIDKLEFERDVAEAKRIEADTDKANIVQREAENEETINAAEMLLARGYPCPTASELAWLQSIGSKLGAKIQPPTPAGNLLDASHSAAAQGCDPWPVIAARERAGRLTNEGKIVAFSRWYRGLRSDFAAGKISSALPKAKGL